MSSSVILEAQRLQLVRYVQVVSATLMVHEWTVLLPDEVDLVWKSKWNATKILYLLSRYLPFFDTPLNLIYYLDPGIRDTTCAWNYTASTWSTAIGMALSELILVVRTYAIYSQSKRVAACLGLLWMTIVITSVPIVHIFTKSVRFGRPPAEGIPGCYMVDASSIVFASYATLLILELVIVIMTMKKGLFHLRHTTNRSRLVKVLYRDGAAAFALGIGIMFFVCLWVLTLGNVLVLVAAPRELLDLLNTFTRVAHSVICCRILLNIRGAARESTNSPPLALHGFDRRVSYGLPIGVGSPTESAGLDTVMLPLDHWRESAGLHHPEHSRRVQWW